MKDLFLFDKDLIYLNHGSFGACPKPIFEEYQRWQLELEFSPVQFITKKFHEANALNKIALGKFINADPNDIVFTPNPTVAFNTVIHSLSLQEGDEILSLNHEYGAMDRTWKFYCQKTGAKYVQQKIQLPIQSKEEVLTNFWMGLSDKTKYIFLSHITSATALILPIKDICDKARKLGLTTIIDGAHVPGHIDLDLKDLDPDYYTGALHKWLLTPKGNTFLYVRKNLQKAMDPLIVSWGYEAEKPGKSTYLDYLEYTGTRDTSAYFTTNAAIKFRADNNWKEKTEDCKQRILEVYPKFCELLETTPICPLNKDFLGQMCSIPINTTKPDEIKETLYNRFNIEIPITKNEDQYFIRISIQPYVSEEDINTLYNALKVLKGERQLLT